MTGQRAVGAKKFFRGLFRSTKWRVGSDGCAIFLFVKKTRHSIRCPFSYLLRKMTTSECSSFSYTQNPPVIAIGVYSNLTAGKSELFPKTNRPQLAKTIQLN